MLQLVNQENLFNEKNLKNIEFIEYDNYKEDFILVEKETFDHFEMLKAHLKIDNIIIDIKDAYRSLEKQESILLDKIKRYGLEKAIELEDMPGTSDYHTGYSVYIAIYDKENWIDTEEELLKREKIFKKIHKALPYFGFIVRFPKNKDSITNHKYEPWHIRYVGEDIAKEIGNKTLEEYLS